MTGEFAFRPLARDFFVSYDACTPEATPAGERREARRREARVTIDASREDPTRRRTEMRRSSGREIGEGPRESILVQNEAVRPPARLRRASGAVRPGSRRGL